jgi:hypothetical protein
LIEKKNAEIKDKKSELKKITDKHKQDISKLQYQVKAAEKSPDRPKKQVLKIEQKGKVIDGNPLEISPSSEFQKLTDSGHMQVVNKLREENR